MAKDTISYEDAFGLTSTPAKPSAGTVSYEEAFGLPLTPPKRRTLASIANDTVIEAAMRQKRIREAQESVYLPSKRRAAMEAGRFAVPD